VTKYSVTVGCGAVAAAELGAVGVPCWPQDAIVSAASENAASGTITRGDVSDMWLLLRTRRVSRSSVPIPIPSQDASHDLKRWNVLI